MNYGSSLGIDDLMEVANRTKSFHVNFSNSRILVLGGTGFLGSWLVESLLQINKQSNLNLQIHVPARNASKLTYLSEKNLQVYPHDFGSEKFLGAKGDFDYIFHALTPTVSDDLDPVLSITKFLLQDIEEWKLPPRLVHLSSGAVYPKSIASIGPIAEQEVSLSTDLTRYGTLKWKLEQEIISKTQSGIINGISPRLFAFAGPRIPLDAHFAIGNFMSQGIRGKDILVQGNSQTVRSYLHPVDAVIWLLKSAVIKENELLHIGSENGFSMATIAEKVARIFDVNTILSGSEQEASIYYPSTFLTRKTLDCSEEIDLDNAITRWKKWIRLSFR
jgi:dTDP-glucose 4,6-dehydratase